MSKKKPVRSSLPNAVTVGVSAIGLLCASLVAYKTIVDHTSYQVSRIIDGDTFETKEKQIVRIDGIQAPEKGLCGYDESVKILRDTILHTNVYIKTVYLDAYRRMVAKVYLSDGSDLSYLLAGKGSVYVNQKSISDPALLASGSAARLAGMGIFGYPCTQTENIKQPECVIKGNRAAGKNRAIYHRPDCHQHPIVKVQLYLGDQWFCTERQARQAGFVPSKDCP